MSLMGLAWGPVVKNPPSNAADTGLISGQGTKIHMPGDNKAQHATTRELDSYNEDPMQQRKRERDELSITETQRR